MSAAYTVQSLRACEPCGGSGKQPPRNDPCSTCEGSGKHVAREAVVASDDVAAYVRELATALNGGELPRNVAQALEGESVPRGDLDVGPVTIRVAGTR